MFCTLIYNWILSFKFIGSGSNAYRSNAAKSFGRSDGIVSDRTVSRARYTIARL